MTNQKTKEEYLSQYMFQLRDEENKRIDSIDSKTATIIGILTIVITLFSDICLSENMFQLLTLNNLKNDCILAIIIILYFVFSIGSLSMMLWSYSIKKYITTPTPAGIIKHYESENKIDEIESTILKDMSAMILHNKKITENKIKKQKYGLYLLFASIITLICFVGYIIIR